MPRQSAASLAPDDILALLDPEERTELRQQLDPDGGAEDQLLTLSPGQLLFAIVRLRLPFIHMMSDIAGMLGDIEAGLNGNVRFIVLPDAADDIRLDFGPQLRGATATALNQSFIAEHSQEIERRLGEFERQLRALCQRVTPTQVSRMDSTGRMLAQRAEQAIDPVSAYRDRYVAEHMFTRTAGEFHPLDLAQLRELSGAISKLEALIDRLLAASPDLEALAGGLKNRVSGVRQAVERKSRSGPVSVGYPLARRRIDDGGFATAQRAMAALQEAVLAGCEFARALDEMYDFLNLHVWRERWRIYELWVLARTVRVLMAAGAEITDRSRIADGAWQLKFTKDSSPVLGLALKGQTIEIYYQLYQGRASTGDMPDLAVRINGGPFVAVIDPKHGHSFSRKTLNSVCERYADAFKPFLSCVCNYFPVRPTEELRRDPLSLVLYGLAPNASEPMARFESELAASLTLAFQELGLELDRRPGLIALFDVSGSASGAGAVLLEALKTELSQMPVQPRADSRALTFSTQIVREGPLDELRSGAMVQGQFDGGTDFGVALRAAVARLDALAAPRELWLFTDGAGVGDLRALVPELKRTRSRIVVFETRDSTLRSLAESVGGRHVRL